MQQLLEELYDELTETAHSTNRIYKAAKEPQNYFTHSWKVHRHIRESLGARKISLEELLKLWIPKWKSEGRLLANPIRVQLVKEEAELLGLDEAKEVDICELFRLIMGLFDM